MDEFFRSARIRLSRELARRTDTNKIRGARNRESFLALDAVFLSERIPILSSGNLDSQSLVKRSSSKSC